MRAPVSEKQLLDRVEALQGLRVKMLAAQFNEHLPEESLRAKGIVGQLIERALGASAGSQAMPDFPELGIELKTIPVNEQGKPFESTYVCVAPATTESPQCFETSLVFQKLAHVLWVPIVATTTHFHDYQIGPGFLWQPDPQTLAILKQDWEEHLERIVLGQLSQVSAHQGTYLQLRPKALNSHVRTLGVNEKGEHTAVSPKGFYLRPKFTQQIIAQHCWVD